MTQHTPSQLAAGDWVRVGARRWPDRPCLVDAAGKGRSYAEVADRVDRLGTALLEAGLRKGDRVAILATDSPAHVEVVLACLRTGVVFCDLNFRLRQPELANIVGRARPKAVFHDGRYRDLVDDITGEVAPLALRCQLDDDGSYERLLADTPPRLSVHSAARGEDIVSIAFTSGTTGIPKGVLQSERMIRNIIYSGIREIDVRPGGLRYAGAPLFHISGIGSTLYAIAGGSTALVLPQFEAETVLGWMQDGGLTHCTLIPTMISALLEVPGAKDARYPALRSIMYGGAPMSPTLLRQVIATFDCDLYNGFGAGTEAGGQTMLFPADHQLALAGREELLGSIGKPILGVDLRLCDESLNDVPPGEV
jgi:acyl-CoA synthetase (AMP-forming)/AMP-acid ligase II